MLPSLGKGLLQAFLVVAEQLAVPFERQQRLPSCLLVGYRLLLEILGPAGLLTHGSPGSVLRAELERHYRATLVLTFGGGVNEVQRDIIAMAGMGMPHYKD